MDVNEAAPKSGPRTFEAVIALFSERREVILHTSLMNDVHLVRFEPGRIELRTGAGAPADLAPRMSRLLGGWTGAPWLVTISSEAGAPTMRAQQAAAARERQGEALDHPLVQAALEAFPGATIAAVHQRATPPAVDSDPATDTNDIEGDVPQ